MDRRTCARLLLAVSALAAAVDVPAQVRGVYPTGMSAIGAGTIPQPGFTYSNLFLFHARDELLGPDGEVVATGRQAVILDLNTLSWVGERPLVGGARYSAAITLIVSNSSLSSDTEGPVSGGGGLGDTFCQPFILGWRTDRADVRLSYGFVAPTGRFDAGASSNVGSGYWTQAPSVGVTAYLTEDRTTTVSFFGMYEFHETQEGTHIRPGDNANLDYSIARSFRLGEDSRLQIGLVGYGQWQTSDKTGPAVTPEDADARYEVNALGVASNLVLSDRKVILGLKYYKEFSSESTVQGHSLHISAAITF